MVFFADLDFKFCGGGVCWSSLGVGCLSSVGISLMFTGLNSCSVRNKVFAD